MKRPLGRGLDNLMPVDSPEETSLSSVPDPSSLIDSPAGVDRLIQGNERSEGQSFPPNHDFINQSLRPERVPSWVFYLADLILMSALLWIALFHPEPTGADYALCLVLVIIAALMGVWPWLRNVLNCDALGNAQQLPQWVLVPCATIGGEPKCLVIHLRRPYVAVEVTETSWKAVNTKPYWIDSPPNLPPGGVKILLSEAARFYQKSVQMNRVKQKIDSPENENANRENENCENENHENHEDHSESSFDPSISKSDS